MKACHTNKLFYRKYKFKAVAKVPGCSFIRYANRDDIDRLFNSESIQEWGGTKYNLTYHYTFENEDLKDWRTNRTKAVWNNRFNLYKLYNWLNENYADHCKVRNEGDKLGFFTSDKETYESFLSTFKDSIIELRWPKNKTHEEFLTNNPDAIVCSKLPYDKYRYKINIKLRGKNANGFGEWINNYKGEIKASEKLLQGIKKGYYYQDGKFVYSTDKDMMLLLTLYLGTYVQSVNEYITEAELDEQHTNT